MDRYTAMGKGGERILTVCADSNALAREEIERQLFKPGRRPFLMAWRRFGSRIEKQN